MISCFEADKGFYWQCTKCKASKGPFEDKAEALSAGQEHEHTHPMEPPAAAPEPRRPR